MSGKAVGARAQLEAAFGPIFERPLFVHAHPDDEALQAGAVTLALADSGARVAVLTATRGERGEAIPGVLPAGASAADFVELRIRETERGRALLGVRESSFLGEGTARQAGFPERRYEDSGMRWIRPGLAGPDANASAASFTGAELREAAGDAAAYARAIGASVLIGYDVDGSYGHPDHVRAHDVGALAAQLAGIPFLQIVSDHQGEDVGAGAQTANTARVAARAVVVAEGAERERLLAALRCFASQFRVEEDGRIRHVGGNTQPLPVRNELILAR